MSIVILKKQAEINAALALMHPIAAEAAKLLAYRIKEDTDILKDPSSARIQEELFQVIGISCGRNGIKPTSDNNEFMQFVNSNKQAILNIGLSLATQGKGKSLLLKAGLVGLGLITGIGIG